MGDQLRHGSTVLGLGLLLAQLEELGGQLDTLFVTEPGNYISKRRLQLAPDQGATLLLIMELDDFLLGRSEPFGHLLDDSW